MLRKRPVSKFRYVNVVLVVLPLLALFFGLIITGGKLTVVQASNESYFVDSEAGSDAADGQSAATAWKTLENINSRGFLPGDTIYIKRGSTFDSSEYGTLTLYGSGTSSAPITITDYGDAAAAAPVFSNQNQWGRALFIQADYVVIEDLKVADSTYVGVGIQPTADHVIVRNVEASAVGIGFEVRGTHNLIMNNTAHDLKMVVNTVGGDDDFGAVGYWVFGSNNELAYNRCIRCRADSYDYGYDGAGIEFSGVVNNTSVHHNWVEDSAAFMEIGGSDQEGRQNHDTLVHHNVVVDSEVVFHFNLLPYQYGTDVQRFVAEHNTVVFNQKKANVANFIQGELVGTQLQLRNNIFYNVDHLARVNGLGAASTNFIHEHNLYYGLSAAAQSLLTPTESVAEPLFVNMASDDFHLTNSSPAIDAGGVTSTAYTVDFDGQPRLVGIVDEGAYEFSEKAIPLPSGCTSQVVQCVKAPCDPIVVCSSPDPSASPTNTFPRKGANTKKR